MSAGAIPFNSQYFSSQDGRFFIKNPENGQILVYDSTIKKWRNADHTEYDETTITRIDADWSIIGNTSFTYVGQVAVVDQAKGMSYNPDGTRWTLMRADGQFRYEEMDADPYNVINKVFVRQIPFESPYQDFSYDDTGYYFAVCKSAFDDELHIYKLDTPFTIEPSSKIFTLRIDTFGNENPTGLDWVGNHIYICNTDGSTRQYLWNPDTEEVSFANKSFFPNNPSRCLRMKPDGTLLIMGQSTNQTLRQYTLSTPYDVSTASFDGAMDLTAVIPASARPSTLLPTAIDISLNGDHLIFTCQTNSQLYYIQINRNPSVVAYPLLTDLNSQTALNYDPQISYNAQTETLSVPNLSVGTLFYQALDPPITGGGGGGGSGGNPDYINIWFFGTQNLTTTLTKVNINNERYRTSNFGFANNEITANKSGSYLVNYYCTTNNWSGSARESSFAELHLNNVYIDGSRVYMYNRQASEGENTGAGSLILELTAGDVIKMMARMISAGNVRVEQGTGITITEITASSGGSGGSVNDELITLTAGSGLSGGGSFTLNQATPSTINFSVDPINYQDLNNLPVLFDGDYNSLANLPTLFDGDYNSLINTPTIPIVNDSSITFNAGTYTTINGTTSESLTLNQASPETITIDLDPTSLSSVATSGSYTDLVNTPTLFSGAYADLTGKPILFDGDYNSLSNTPSIPNPANNSTITLSAGTLLTGGGNFTTDQSINETITFNVNESAINYNNLSNLPSLFSGNYNDLTNKPTIPPAPANAIITLSAGNLLTGGGDFTTDQSINETITFNVDEASINYNNINNTPVLSSVATSGNYNDLTNLPSIPSPANNPTITLTAGTLLTGGGNFTLDQATNKTITFNVDESSIDYNNISNTPTIGNGTLTLSTGTYLSGGTTFTANQSGSATFNITTNATPNNTGSTLVARDNNGNFSAGTITADLNGVSAYVSAIQLGNSAGDQYVGLLPQGGASGKAVEYHTPLIYNTNTRTLTATNFDGTATQSTMVKSTTTNSNSTFFPTFTDVNTTGFKDIFNDAHYTYNPSTNTLNVVNLNVSGTTTTTTTSVSTLNYTTLNPPLPDATITLNAGTLLTGGGNFTTNQGTNETITFNVDESSINYNNLNNLPSLFSGNYNDLTNKPSIPNPANNSTITLTAGTLLTGGGNFTTDQGVNETITFNVDEASINYNNINNTPLLSSVATSGLYSDLTGTPTIPNPANDSTITLIAGSLLTGGGNFTTDQLGNQTITFDVDEASINYNNILNTPSLSAVATSGNYNDLLNLPTIPNPANNGTITLGAGTLLTGGGNFTTNQAVNETIIFNVDEASINYNNINNTPALSSVATSGDYNDLSNLPSIPSPANNSLITLTAGTLLTGGGTFNLDQATAGTITFNVDEASIDYNNITGTPALSSVATSGDYSDLTGTPTINDSAITFTGGNYVIVNGTLSSSEDITLNQSSPETITFDVDKDALGVKTIIQNPPTPEVFDLAGATSITKQLDAPTNPTEDVEYSASGDKLFVVILAQIREYPLTTPFVLPATLPTLTSSIGFTNNARGISFDPTGIYFAVCTTNNNTLHIYKCSTAFTLTDATSIQTYNTSTNGGIASPYCVSWCKNNKIFVGRINGTTSRYAFDPNTELVAYDNNTQDITTSTTMEGFKFSPNGTKVWVVHRGGDSLFEYSLGTAYDLTTISTGTPFTLSFSSVGITGINPTGIDFKQGNLIVSDDNNTADEIHHLTIVNTTTHTMYPMLYDSTEDTYNYETGLTYDAESGALSVGTLNYTTLNPPINTFSGDYNDLTNLPTLFDGDYNSLTNLPTLFDGSYTSLTNVPSFSAVATSGDYNDLINAPTGGLAYDTTITLTAGTLLTGGGTFTTNQQTASSITFNVDEASINYNNLSNLPTLFSGNYNDLSNLPTLFDGDYNSLTNLPTIPNPANNSLITLTAGTLLTGGGTFNLDQATASTITFNVDESSINYNNLSNLPTLFDGDYNSLTNQPAINNATLTLSTGTYLSGSATFTANQGTNATFSVSTNATNVNTASTLVARDSSGNFSAGTITADLTGTASQSTQVYGTQDTITSSFLPIIFTTSDSTGFKDLRMTQTSLSYRPSDDMFYTTQATITTYLNAPTTNLNPTTAPGSGDILISNGTGIYRSTGMNYNSTTGITSGDYESAEGVRVDVANGSGGTTPPQIPSASPTGVFYYPAMIEGGITQGTPQTRQPSATSFLRWDNTNKRLRSPEIDCDTLTSDDITNTNKITTDELEVNILYDSLGSQGTTGQVLTSTGDNACYWATPSSSGGSKAYINVYKNNTQNLSTTLAPVQFNNTRIASSLFNDLNFSPGYVINVIKAGVYKIDYYCTTENYSGSTRETSYAQIELNGVYQSGTRIWMYNRTSADGETTGSGSLILSLSNGDAIRMTARELSGGNVRVQSGSGITMTEL